jgi:hypothetical protein
MVPWGDTTQHQQADGFCSEIGFDKLDRTYEEIQEYESIDIGNKIDGPKIQLIVDLNCQSPNIEVQRYDFEQIMNYEKNMKQIETFLESVTKDINVTELMNDCVDSVMNYVSYASGCEPCGEYATSIPNMPRKGILKKSSTMATTRFPNRSMYYYCPEDDEDVCNADDSITLNRSVSFSSVDIKEFKMTLGHHPSVSSGPPVMLDKTHLMSQVVPLDDFEASRSQTRKTSRRQLKISRTDRNGILDSEGFTPEEINDACVAARKIRQQREESIRTGALLSAIEDLLETVSSKYNLSEIGKCF